jgi:hypothetical protein
MYQVTIDGKRLTREFPSFDHVHEFAVGYGGVVVAHYGTETGAAACYEGGKMKWLISDGWLDF